MHQNIPPLDGVNFSPGEYVVTDAIVLPKLRGWVGGQREINPINNN
jgi:hypothetical protein